MLCADPRDNPRRALLSKKEHSCTCTICVKPLFCMYNFSLTYYISKMAWLNSWGVHVYVGGTAGSAPSTGSIQA